MEFGDGLNVGIKEKKDCYHGQVGFLFTGTTSTIS